MKSATSIVLFCIVQLLLHSPEVRADDWPQWMGPHRDNIWRETGILKSFPDAGPAVLWRAPVAGGYSGPSVANGFVIVTDYITKDDVKVANFERKKFTGIERIVCLDEKTGDQKWTHDYPVEYSISYPAGPRCSPIIESNYVYTVGAEGHLFCLKLDSGEVVWSKDLKDQYKTKAALWGYAGHPLIDGNKLICIVGGEGTHAVAFDRLTGEQLWATLSSGAQGYSPPTIVTVGGRRQLILVKPDSINAVDPETGKPLWSVPYEATNGSIIMSPIVLDDHLFIAGYSSKNLLLKLGTESPTAEVVWRDLRKKAMSPVNVQPILDGKLLYGMGQGGDFFAVDFKTGERLWDTPWPLGKRPQQTGTAFIVRHDDRYWLFNELGELIIAKLTPSGHEELDRAKVIEPTNVAFGRSVVWSAPAFANKHVYLRNDKECICLDLSDASSTN